MRRQQEIMYALADQRYRLRSEVNEPNKKGKHWLDNETQFNIHINMAERKVSEMHRQFQQLDIGESQEREGSPERPTTDSIYIPKRANLPQHQTIPENSPSILFNQPLPFRPKMYNPSRPFSMPQYRNTSIDTASTKGSRRNVTGDTTIHTTFTETPAARPMGFVAGYGGSDVFTGEEGQSVVRWLYRFNQKHGKKADGTDKAPSDWLQLANSMLEGKAGRWVDREPTLRRMFKDVENATVEQVAEFKRILIDHFSGMEEDIEDPVGDIQALKQQPLESLKDLSARALNLLKTAGGHDYVPDMDDAKRALLTMTIAYYIRAMKDEQLRVRMSGYERQPDASLRGAYATAESEWRKIRAEHEMFEAWRENEKNSLQAEVAKYTLKGRMPPRTLIDRLREYQSDDDDMEDEAPETLRARVTNSPHQGTVREVTTTVETSRRDEPRTQEMVLREPRTPVATRQQLPAPQRPQPRGGFDPTASANPYVNGTIQYRNIMNQPLCFKCGERGHLSPDCTNEHQLSILEQEYLRDLVYEHQAKVRLAREAREKEAAATQERQNDGSGPATGTNRTPLGARFVGARISEVSTPTQSKVVRFEDTESFGKDGEFPQVSVRGVSVMDNAAKRQRTEGTQDDTQMADSNTVRPKAKARARRTGLAKKPPATIQGMLEQPAIDVRKVMLDATVTIPWMHLLAVSPYVRDEAKRLSTAVRKKREKKAPQAEAEGTGTTTTTTTTTTTAQGNTNTTGVAANAAGLKSHTVAQVKAAPTRPSNLTIRSMRISEQLRANIENFRNQNHDVRAYGLPALVSKDKGSPTFQVHRNQVLADQGSDVNLIYEPLRKYMDLKLRPLKDLGLMEKESLSMTTADGGSHELKHWVSFNIDVMGIKREVWAFVCPGTQGGLALLLGCPYLANVNAHIHVRDGTIELGDPEVGEHVVISKAPPRPSTEAKIAHRNVDAMSNDEEADWTRHGESRDREGKGGWDAIEEDFSDESQDSGEGEGYEDARENLGKRKEDDENEDEDEEDDDEDDEDDENDDNDDDEDDDEDDNEDEEEDDDSEDDDDEEEQLKGKNAKPQPGTSKGNKGSKQSF